MNTLFAALSSDDSEFMKTASERGRENCVKISKPKQLDESKAADIDFNIAATIFECADYEFDDNDRCRAMQTIASGELSRSRISRIVSTRKCTRDEIECDKSKGIDL